jgi:hypothetical protein
VTLQVVAVIVSVLHQQRGTAGRPTLTSFSFKGGNCEV